MSPHTSGPLGRAGALVRWALSTLLSVMATAPFVFEPRDYHALIGSHQLRTSGRAPNAFPGRSAARSALARSGASGKSTKAPSVWYDWAETCRIEEPPCGTSRA